MNEEQQLSDLLAKTPENGTPGLTLQLHRMTHQNYVPAPTIHPETDFAQWQSGPNGTFRPGPKTCAALPSGAYMVGQDAFGPYLESMKLMTDSLVELPKTANVRVLDGIRKFWASKERYARHCLTYKRGVLLWGPPGSGKTREEIGGVVTAQLLIQEIITLHEGHGHYLRESRFVYFSTQVHSGDRANTPADRVT